MTQRTTYPTFRHDGDRGRDEQPPTLFEELSQRRDGVLQLLDLAREQLQLIEGDGFDSLWQLQLQKEKLASRLSVQSSGPPPLLDRWLAERDSLPPSVRRHCDQLIDEAEEGMRLLMEEEAISAEALRRRMASTRDELLTLADGRKSHLAHSPPEPQKGRRLVDFEA
ncbi:MAG: hypothetical protein IT428_13050 [Planctomycetaceae bacterium]|nr:hypothetical protein [Planctomycetaceae bacterium]